MEEKLQLHESGMMMCYTDTVTDADIERPFVFRAGNLGLETREGAAAAAAAAAMEVLCLCLLLRPWYHIISSKSCKLGRSGEATPAGGQ